MKILAMEVEAEGVKAEQFTPHLKAEARHVWELYQRGVLRESYFPADRSEAVLILECADAKESRQTPDSLSLVQAGLSRFEVIPLVPYPGFGWLFGES